MAEFYFLQNYGRILPVYYLSFLKDFFGRCLLLGQLLNLFYNVLFLALCPLLWSCCSCCCGLPPIAAPLLIAAAAVGCLAAPSAGAALAAPLQGLPLAAPLLLLQILGRKMVRSTVLPSPRLELVTAQLALASQQLSLLGRACLTRPSQDSLTASLSTLCGC